MRITGVKRPSLPYPLAVALYAGDRAWAGGPERLGREDSESVRQPIWPRVTSNEQEKSSPAAENFGISTTEELLSRGEILAPGQEPGNSCYSGLHRLEVSLEMLCAVW
jgi:hypothetical protein